MKLEQFIQYKSNCPICEHSLKTIFHSRRQQSQRIEDNRLMFIFNLFSLKRNAGPAYKAGYSFNTSNNDTYIEFYDKDNTKFNDASPEWLRVRFWEFDKNLKGYKFYRECVNPSCKRYMYDSNSFYINYKTCNIGDLQIKSERVGLVQSLEDGYRIMKINNDYVENKTNLTIFKDGSDTFAPVSSGIPFFGAGVTDITLPIIKLSSLEETAERLNKLLVFS